MEHLVETHGKIMDKYDPEKRVALVVDEWGTWHAVEKGTNPGFLYQQNTVRDALAAGITLNIFNNHCDRVNVLIRSGMFQQHKQLPPLIRSLLMTLADSMILTTSIASAMTLMISVDSTTLQILEIQQKIPQL